jgi:hypothetical protein
MDARARQTSKNGAPQRANPVCLRADNTLRRFTMSVIRHPLVRLLPLALMAAPFAASAARVLTPEELRLLPPSEAKAYVLKRVAEQARPGRSARADAADVTPPVLTAFNAPAKVKAGATLNLRFSATDDVSGIQSLNAYAYNSAGAYIFAGAYGYLPATKLKSGANGQINPYTAPGDYTFEWAYLYDTAGNYSYLDAAGLAALGNTVVTVTNTTGYDATPPNLVSGTVLTPSLSLSATHPGTTQAAFAGMALRTTDVGNTAVSGLAWVWANFCLQDLSACFSLYGNNFTTGQSKTTIQLGGQPGNYGGQPTGDYLLAGVQLSDNANNYVYLYSTAFGGSTDFSKLFPAGTSIQLTP